jgi:hypothetical protein
MIAFLCGLHTGRWCGTPSSTNGECVSTSTACLPGYSYFTTPSTCPAPPSCSSASTCSACILKTGCGWCASTASCTSGTRSGATASFCSSSNWRFGTCYYNNSHLAVLWIVLGVGTALCVLALVLVICIRRARQASASNNDTIELSVSPVGDASSGFSYTAEPSPSFGASAMPGYMYTTTSSGANQPTYLYTAVPVGAPVMSIPN